MASAELQRAIFRALSSDPAIAALVGSRIYDDVPHGDGDGAPAFPYITLGEVTETEAGTSSSEAFEVTYTMHAWSRADSRLEVKSIIDAIRACLHNRPPALSAGALTRFMFDFAETLRDPDGETYHGAIRFRGYLQYA